MSIVSYMDVRRHRMRAMIVGDEIVGLMIVDTSVTLGDERVGHRQAQERHHHTTQCRSPQCCPPTIEHGANPTVSRAASESRLEPWIHENFKALETGCAVRPSFSNGTRISSIRRIHGS